jgi:hypothetical protein
MELLLNPLTSFSGMVGGKVDDGFGGLVRHLDQSNPSYSRLSKIRWNFGSQSHHQVESRRGTKRANDLHWCESEKQGFDVHLGEP